jgi:hypothetical protein
MLNSHKNTLYEAVIETGYDPNQFTVEDGPFILSDGDSRDGCTLTFNGTALQFAVLVCPRDFNLFECSWALFAPDFPFSTRFPARNYIEIGVIAFKLKEWLANVVEPFLEDTTVPNLWAEAKTQSELFSSPPISGNEPGHFTEPEKALLRAAIAQVRLNIEATFTPPTDRSELVNERLDYLSQGLERLNRFDWRGILVSVMFNIATNLTLDTTQGAKLYQLFKEAFSTALHLIR